MRFLSTTVGVIGILALGFSFVRMIALKRPVQKDTSTFFRDEFEVVAHRGGSLENPENTLTAFEAAAKISPDILIELDVHLSKDGELVVIHDPSLDRTTNGTGFVRDKTVAELKSFDAGYRYTNEIGEHNFRGKGIQIPTLREVLEKITDRRLIIEIKSDEPIVEEKIASLIKEFEAQDRVMFGSQKSTILARLKKLQPRWNYCAGRDEILRTVMLLAMYLESVGSIPGSAYLIPEKDKNIQVFSERLKSELHRRGKRVLIWTVNQEEDMLRLITQGVDGLITDRPSLLYKLAKGR